MMDDGVMGSGHGFFHAWSMHGRRSTARSIYYLRIVGSRTDGVVLNVTHVR